MSDSARNERTADAVVLLSGGVDSTTAACWALRQGLRVVALSVDYGQRQRIELERAARIAERLGVPHQVVRVDLSHLRGSALTDPDTDVPRDRDLAAMASGGVPPTYVPARNTLLLSLALGLAEVTGARTLVIGANAMDQAGYPDCRPAFLEAFAALARVATAAGAAGAAFEVRAPLLALDKAGIVALALELGAPLELTWSCYDPTLTGSPCRRCDACRLRREGFLANHTPDPAEGDPA